LKNAGTGERVVNCAIGMKGEAWATAENIKNLPPIGTAKSAREEGIERFGALRIRIAMALAHQRFGCLRARSAGGKA
jgi:hypothetical protein